MSRLGSKLGVEPAKDPCRKECKTEFVRLMEGMPDGIANFVWRVDERDSVESKQPKRGERHEQSNAGQVRRRREETGIEMRDERKWKGEEAKHNKR